MSTKTWVEKYRPKKLKSIAQQNNLVNILKHSFKNKTISHMLRQHAFIFILAEIASIYLLKNTVF